MTTRLAAAIAVAAALLAPTSAAAGGFATVGVDPLPNGIGPGKTWGVQLTILQHGRTPLEGVDPRVIVTRGTERQVFAARPTRRPGVYRAQIVFPSAGTWHYVVDDGFTMTHTFPPVRVRVGGGDRSPVAGAEERRVSTAAAGGGSSGAATSAGGAADGDDPDLPLALVVAAVAGLAAALGTAALRRRRPRPAPEGR
ncbi:MAG: hypothetical protein H0T69_18655 [Thermoleophilaceae bacterium]|nr:hypothetical protein [Thermoleophilaceae bacterium]